MLLLEIYSPSVDRSFDFQISEDMLTSDAISSFCEMIARKSGSEGRVITTGMALYDVRGIREIDRDRTLKDNGIVSGMKLILA